MEEYFENNKILQEFQFGFRNKKGTTSELLTLFHKLMEAKEEGKEIALTLFDLSSVFDTIDHSILLEKLSIYGFDTLALSWVKSYLQDRGIRETVPKCQNRQGNPTRVTTKSTALLSTRE